MNQSREAHRSARPLHSPEGGHAPPGAFEAVTKKRLSRQPPEVRDCHLSKPVPVLNPLT
jgi:hypothetical protein